MLTISVSPHSAREAALSANNTVAAAEEDGMNYAMNKNFQVPHTWQFDPLFQGGRS
jgi:hypothetical protein